jgi:hypothetical protein
MTRWHSVRTGRYVSRHYALRHPKMVRQEGGDNMGDEQFMHMEDEEAKPENQQGADKRSTKGSGKGNTPVENQGGGDGGNTGTVGSGGTSGAGDQTGADIGSTGDAGGASQTGGSGGG